ncbi:MAG: isopentenyl phosphate kinase [Chloroflexi bacterium]|nr:isopentenyl phosphate kinase [Chloroflexota bacterium]MCY4248491.1 isopentenyl phosphate kinase [Chloroflexota bacterium]
MTILIKLGGSLVTDKLVANSFRRDMVRQIAAQVATLFANADGRRLVLGHGSGSFGHVAARRYRTLQGVVSAKERLGMARVGAVAAELSGLILAELLAAELPALRFPPSALLTTRDRRIASLETRPLLSALQQGSLPLVHGDVALDSQVGGAIVSTEAVFAALVEPLDVSEIILLGEVAGVLDDDGMVIPRITPATFPALKPWLGGASGIDVTGGMLHKVQAMVELVARQPGLTVTIADGRRADVLLDLLLRQRALGTRIAAAF